ncbi:unnamed protein product, partial [Ilex paraguariensis]
IVDHFLNIGRISVRAVVTQVDNDRRLVPALRDLSYREELGSTSKAGIVMPAGVSQFQNGKAKVGSPIIFQGFSRRSTSTICGRERKAKNCEFEAQGL